MSDYKIKFETMEWQIPIKGVRAKIFKSGEKQIRLIEYSKEMPLHWCDKGHYGMILEGEMEIEYEHETIIYKTGDGVFIPAGPDHRHRGKVLTDCVKVIFVEDV